MVAAIRITRTPVSTFILAQRLRNSVAQKIQDEYTKDLKEWEKETMYGEFAGERGRHFTENASIIENPNVATDDHFGALTQNFLTRLSAATCIK